MIKKVLVLSSVILIASCDVANEVLTQLETVATTPQSNQLTNDEVIGGLKEALTKGIEKAVDVTSIVDGFNNNLEIKLPFPEDAIKVKEKALDLGLDKQVNDFELNLNRAAENASKMALPIFKDAILNMSIQDGFQILKGGNGAATSFLKNATSKQLYDAFLPKVKEAIDQVKLTSYWNPIITKYNGVMKLTGGQQLNPELNDYVTQKAITGLFLMVEKEENNIRQNPTARVTDLLKKVFGYNE